MPNKINVTILALSIGILQVFQGFTTAKVLSINRNRRGQPWINKDSFSIPSSLCLQNNGHDECEPFRALNDKHQNCSCYCPSQNSSFVYHSNGWTCLQNGRVRDLQDCRNTVVFYPESNNLHQPLGTLDIGDEWYTNISFSEEAGSGWEHCEVHLNSSWYLGCNGSRLVSSQYLSKIKELFALRDGTADGRPHRFALLVNTDVPDAQMLKGKIINLGIQCSIPDQPQYPAYRGCLMFKLSGQQTCNVSVPSLQKFTKLKPTKPTFTRKTIHVPISSSTSSSQRTSTTLVPGSTALVTQTTTVAESTTTSLPPNVRPSPSSGREESTDEGLSSVGLIAGVTVATLALAVFIIGFLVYHRRHSKKKPRSSANGNTTQDTVIMSPQTNSAVQSDGQNGYGALGIMAEEPRTKDGSEPDHFQVCLNSQERHIIYSPEKTQEPFYHVLEKPNADNEGALLNDGSINLKQPVNNLQEKLSSAERLTGHGSYGGEPVYNVLEDPNLEETEGLGQHGNISSAEPIYNTLEEPTSDDLSKANCNYKCTNEPVYNVLEEEAYPTILAADGHDASDLQDPVYNVLEGP